MIQFAYNVFAPAGAVIIWAAVIYKLRDLRDDPHNLALQALCGALAFPAVAYTLAAPWISVRVDHAVGIPNVATLLIYGSDIVHTAFAQLLLLAWTHPREQVWARFRWRLLVVGLALATMASLFLMAQTPTEQPIDFDATYATTPYITEFLVVFYAAFGGSMAWLGRLCWRYAGMVGRLWLRRGLRLITVGTVFGLGYCICKLVYIGARVGGHDLPAWDAAALLIAGSGAPLLCAGLTLPAWGPRLSAARAWLGQYGAYRRLYPLWRELAEAVPEVALVPPWSSFRDALAMRQLRFRLSRRMIEIRDGQRVLRRYCAPEIIAAARESAMGAGLHGDEFQAAVEAASLRAALLVRAHTGMVTTRMAAGEDNQMRTPTGVSPLEEVAWLVRVARAFRSSPVAAAARIGAGIALRDQGDHVSTSSRPGHSGLQKPKVILRLLAARFSDAGRAATRMLVRQYDNREQIRQLNPEQDYHRIYRTMALVEFRFDMLMGLQFAFYRTFGVPSIACVLDQSGELTQRYFKRGIDTALLMYEAIDHGFDDPRGREVVRRLNRIHHPYNNIDNAEYLYVLGALLVTPIRWLERYGWRPLCCHERIAAYTFYRELGRRMAVRDIPPSYETFEVFFDAYERDHLAYTPAGERLMQSGRDAWATHFSTVLPPVAATLLRPFAAAYIDSMLDDKLRQAVGVRTPSPLVRISLHLVLKARARLLRWMPTRHEPVESKQTRYGFPIDQVYPYDYTISQLGPAGPREVG